MGDALGKYLIIKTGVAGYDDWLVNIIHLYVLIILVSSFLFWLMLNRICSGMKWKLSPDFFRLDKYLYIILSPIYNNKVFQILN